MSTATTSPATTMAEVVAAAHAAAADVDRAARFPHEAIDALRSSRLLVPAGPCDLVERCHAIAAVAGACGSSGLVFAMHTSLFETLRRHAPAAGPVADFLTEAAERQPLLAGMTSEAGIGGALRRSSAAVAVAAGMDDVVELHKSVPVASYAAYADAVLVTARRSDGAAASDQVVVFAPSDDVELHVTSSWDALGMRGTSSAAVDVSLRATPSCVLPEPFAGIAPTLVATSHVAWAACWAGIAASAVEVTRSYLRQRRGAADQDVTALRNAALSQARGELESLWSAVLELAARASTPDRGSANELSFNHLKLTASETAVRVVMRCFEIVGVAAYQEPAQSKFSLSRQLRDVLSSLVMISNDRVRAGTGLLSLVAPSPVLPPR